MSNLNSMLYWWPLVQGTGVPMPETILVEVSDAESELLWHSLDMKPLPQSLLERIAQAAQKIGYPCFLRGDLTSGKHGYKKTCFVPQPEELASHVWVLTEDGVLKVDEVPLAFAVRKLLDLAAPFTAFNGLPIAPERRYFVRDGEVICHHVYWELDQVGVACVIQSPAFTEEFLSVLQSLGGESFPAKESGSAPLSFGDLGWAFDTACSSDVFVQLNEQFGLPLLEPKIRQERLCYLGCVSALYSPMEQRFTVECAGLHQLRRGPSEDVVKQLDSLRLNLTNADARIINGTTAAIIPAAPVAGTINSERAIGIQKPGQIRECYWVAFHVITPPDKTIPHVYAVVMRRGPIRFYGTPAPPDWKLTLAQLNRESVSEVIILRNYATRLGAVLPGYWSVDFARDRSGTWWFIDAALAERSWHPEHQELPV